MHAFARARFHVLRSDDRPLPEPADDARPRIFEDCLAHAIKQMNEVRRQHLEAVRRGDFGSMSPPKAVRSGTAGPKS